jgi:hypothetical protein
MWKCSVYYKENDSNFGNLLLPSAAKDQKELFPSIPLFLPFS